jgi:hypothetical protein
MRSEEIGGKWTVCQTCSKHSGLVSKFIMKHEERINERALYGWKDGEVYEKEV